MIPRVTKGASARAALSYDFGPGRREEHSNPRTVAGNLPGGWREQAEAMDRHLSQRPDMARPVMRASLRAAPQDRTLSDEEWGRIAQQYVQRMGYEGSPWTATRHGEDHIHVTVSRLSWEGRAQSTHLDYPRAQNACRAIEREHHLVDASQRYDRDRPQVSHGERERAARTGMPAERERLRERLDGATARSGGTAAGYEKALDEAGVVYRRNEASTGRVSGYSYGLAGHADAAGEQVFYKGSQLGKEYRWGQVQQRLEGQTQQAPRTLGQGHGAAQAAGGRGDGRGDGGGTRARSVLERIRRNDVSAGRGPKRAATSGRAGQAAQLPAAQQQEPREAGAPDVQDAHDGGERARTGVEAAMQRVRQAARQREQTQERGQQR